MKKRVFGIWLIILVAVGVLFGPAMFAGASVDGAAKAALTGDTKGCDCGCPM